MNIRFFALSLILSVALLPIAANAQGMGGGGMGGMGGGDDGGSGDVATNDITARWNGAVAGTGATPRTCSVDNPQPNGTHTPYFCNMDPIHTVSVTLSNGTVQSQKGKPDPGDALICATGFAFEGYPNGQYVVGVGGGEICTDEDGCPMTVHSRINGQYPATPYNKVKLVGHGVIPKSDTLNPFACPTDGSGPTMQPVPIDEVEVLLSNSTSSKQDLTCLFDTDGIVDYHVTPVCPVE